MNNTNNPKDDFEDCDDCEICKLMKTSEGNYNYGDLAEAFARQNAKNKFNDKKPKE